VLDGRHLDAPEAVKTPHAIERRDHRGEAVGVFVQQALCAANGLNGRHCRRLMHNSAVDTKRGGSAEASTRC
jgi:hypothetical protein